MGAKLLPVQGDPGEGAGAVASVGGGRWEEKKACKESGFISSSVYGCGELGPYAYLGFIASDGRFEIVFPVEKRQKSQNFPFHVEDPCNQRNTL